MIEIIKSQLHSFFISMEWANEDTVIVEEFILLFLIFAIAFACYFIARKFLIRLVLKITQRTKAKWDDYVFNEKILKNLTHIIPAVIIYALTPLAFSQSPVILAFLLKLCMVYIVAVSLRFINSFLGAVFDVINRQEAFRGKSLRGILQVIQIILIFIGVVIIIGVLIDKSPTTLLAGLGASAAILTLVFKDTLTGLISGVQLTANDMLRPGDWITVPKYGADGVVIDVTLHTVKVRNFDNTITTVPPYLLVSDSFQNWRGMFDSGGRRVKRSVSIDMNSVKFCTQQMLDKYKRIELIRSYIEEKEQEIAEYNRINNIDDSVVVNGRRQTNLGIFRAYLDRYLKSHPEISKELIAMVRQLQPTEKGIPLELYFFSSEKRWVFYENIQSDVFDHVLAIIPEFDLRVFQNPSGADFRSLSEKCS